MAVKGSILPTSKPAENVPAGQLTLQELFEFIQRRGAERVQLIRVTGQGRLDATIVPVSTGNLMIVLEINPNKGVVV